MGLGMDESFNEDSVDGQIAIDDQVDRCRVKVSGGKMGLKSGKHAKASDREVRQ